MRRGLLTVLSAALLATLTTTPAVAAPPPRDSRVAPSEVPSIDVEGREPSARLKQKLAERLADALTSRAVVKAPGATFVFTYREPVAPEWKAVFEEAGRRWGSVISSTQPIQVVARQLVDVPDLGGAANSRLVITGGDTPGIVPDTAYPTALFNAITGRDAIPPGTFTDTGPECTAAGCDILISVFGPTAGYHYGLDGRPPADKVDALSLAMHEIGHGLGYTDGLSLAEDGTIAFPNLPTPYARQLTDPAGRSLGALPSRSAELRAAAESGTFALTGPATVLAHGRPLRVYTTTPYLSGVSLSHVDTSELPLSIMGTAAQPGSPSFRGVARKLDTPTIAVLADLGMPMRNRARVADTLAPERRGAVLVFPIALTEPAITPVTIRYKTVDGSATAGSDYEARSGTITIKAGQRLGAVTVPLVADAMVEPRETMTLELTTVAGVGVGDGTATGTILGDGRAT